jgi:hypothetical protein
MKQSQNAHGVDCGIGAVLGEHNAPFVRELRMHTRERSVLFVEVKSPSDQLSARQRLWMKHLVSPSIGIAAEVCRVVFFNN